MTIIYNGQKVPVSGWFEDRHGHRLFLQQGHFAPICPRFGPETAMWRLLKAVGGPPR